MTYINSEAYVRDNCKHVTCVPVRSGRRPTIFENSIFFLHFEIIPLRDMIETFLVVTHRFESKESNQRNYNVAKQHGTNRLLLLRLQRNHRYYRNDNRDVFLMSGGNTSCCFQWNPLPSTTNVSIEIHLPSAR